MKAQQLKNAILQLAVQGKLVPQNPADEPANELLKRIKAEKEQLIKAKKIKPSKNPSEIFRGSDNLPYEKIGNAEAVCIADQVPFEIPDNWEWVRLGDITEIARGGSPRPIQHFLTTKENGIPWIKIGDTDKGGKYINSTKEYIIKEGISKSRMVYKGDFLLTNSMSFGRPYILNIDGCIHDGWLVISNLFKAFSMDYLYYLLSSSFAYYQFCQSVSGAVVKNLNSDKVSNSLIPLPPLAEQQRIVAKIEELMPLVEEYDLVETKVSQLNAAFPDKLKKSILQEAVQGKLVAQDPTDEPASELLKRIAEEKKALIKAGKLKKGKNESYIFRRDNSHYEMLNGQERCIDDEIPFEIPDNWEWVRLGSLMKFISDGTHKTPHYVEQGIPFLSVQNISSGKLTTEKIKYITEKEHQKLITRTNPTLGDILFCRIGTLGKAIKVTWNFQFSIFVSLGLLRSIIPDIVDYIIFIINSSYGSSWIQEHKVGGGTHTYKINLKDIPQMLIPLPPLAEQQRIVSKIEELIPNIEKLAK